MFLKNLHDLNNQVDSALRAAGLTLINLPVNDTYLPLDFLKPDYTTLSIQVPTHRINVNTEDDTPRTIGDWAQVIVNFVLNAANEFTKPRIHMSHVYLGYNPSRFQQDAVLCFDIAVWDYLDDEAQWLTVGDYADQHRLGHNIGFHRPPSLGVDTRRHELLKQTPFEINLWTQNILRDVGFLTAAGSNASVLEYTIKLEQELLAGARAAADVLNKMQRAAQIHDVLNSLWRGDKFIEAADLLSKTLNQKVGLQGVNDQVLYLVVNDDLFTPGQVFALIAGLDVHDAEQDDEIEDNLTEEQRAVGIIMDLGRQRRDARARAIKSEIYRSDSQPEDLNDIDSRPLHYIRSGTPQTQQERDEEEQRQQAKVPKNVFMSLDPVFSSKETVENAVRREMNKGDDNV